MSLHDALWITGGLLFFGSGSLAFLAHTYMIWQQMGGRDRIGLCTVIVGWMVAAFVFMLVA